MKIERKEDSGLVEFGSLKCGDVFEVEGELYIKSEYIMDRKNDYEYNCIILEDGFLYGLADTDKVKHYPNAKLVLED